MIVSDPILASLASELAAAVDTNDTGRLREYLRGRHLPALGGDLTPAEILEAAVQQEPETARRLASTLASLLAEESGRLKSPTPGDLEMIDNALRLAAVLPPDEQLLAIVRALFFQFWPNPRVTSQVFRDLELPLWQALIHQQTDRELASVWLRVLNNSYGANLLRTAKGRTLLFTAWRGLLWVPSAPDAAGTPVIDFDLVEDGLLALHQTLLNEEDGERWLGYALEVLTETFPRSAAFWESHFTPKLPDWPASLQKVALQKWPGLAHHSRLTRRASA